MRASVRAVMLAAVLSPILAPAALGEQMQTVERWGMLELAVSNPRTYANPFMDVALESILTSPSGKQMSAYGFYDGGQTWRLRFMPDEEGQWNYQAKFSDDAPGASGSFQCTKGKLHGPLQVRKDNPLWFEFADETPFYLRAFHTWTIDAVDQNKLTEALDFLQKQGFNTCVGPHLFPPDRIPWQSDPSGQIDFSRFNLALWQNMDRALRTLADRGMILIPFSILGGTNTMPKIPTWEQQDLFLRYWLARWGGFWNATYQPTSEWEKRWTDKEIIRIGRRIRELDGGRHLISVHALTAGNKAVQHQRWFAYHTVQDKLMDWNPTKYTWFIDLHKQVPKPILAHECLWEGNSYQKEAGLDIDNLRKGAWVIALAGGQINYDDTAAVYPLERAATTRPKVPFYIQMAIVVRDGQFYPYLKILGDFMQSLPFWRMRPQPQLANTGICLAEAGHEYVIYTLDGGRVVTDLTAGKGSFLARWLNPRTGQFGEWLEVKENTKPLFAAPDENDWILHIKREK